MTTPCCRSRRMVARYWFFCSLPWVALATVRSTSRRVSANESGHLLHDGLEKAQIAGGALGHGALGSGMGHGLEMVADGDDRPDHVLVELEPDPGRQAQHHGTGSTAHEHEIVDLGCGRRPAEIDHGSGDRGTAADGDQREEQEDAQPEAQPVVQGLSSLRYGRPAPASRSRTMSRSSSIENGLVR